MSRGRSETARRLHACYMYSRVRVHARAIHKDTSHVAGLLLLLKVTLQLYLVPGPAPVPIENHELMVRPICEAFCREAFCSELNGDVWYECGACPQHFQCHSGAPEFAQRVGISAATGSMEQQHHPPFGLRSEAPLHRILRIPAAEAIASPRKTWERTYGASTPAVVTGVHAVRGVLRIVCRSLSV